MDTFDPKLMRELAEQGTRGSLDMAREQLSDLGEALAALHERQKPIRARRMDAFNRGDFPEAKKATEELAVVSAQIRAFNQAIHQLAEECAKKVREMLRPGEAVPK